MEIEELIKNLPAEISVGESAKILGFTERTVTNYLKSRQLEGKKVGKKWFVKTESILNLRPSGLPLEEVKLPPLEDHRSKKQAEKHGVKWKFCKDDSSKRGPLRLSAFGRVCEAYELFLDIAPEISSEKLQKFIKDELESVSDDIGAGFYNYGPIKKRLYNRARILTFPLYSPT